MNKKKTIIGIPKEIKDKEFRVGATPETTRAFIERGHEVIVQKDAGKNIGYSNTMYKQAGAKIVDTAQEVYESEMIIKVKEPQKQEFPYLFEGQILFCYLHLAPDPVQTENLLKQKVIAIAYETITDKKGKLPLLIPMSEVAGRVSIQAGAWALQMANGGKGMLLGGIPGVRPANVVVLGGGVVGTEAIRMALGLGANVTVFDKSLDRLRELNILYSPALKTLFPTPSTLEEVILSADLIVGAVLVPGGKAPRLITEEMVKKMEEGTVIVDVAIDQGGCSETSHITTHSDPIYRTHGVVHYCVTNMPSACARTATQGLTATTLPYALLLADKGVKKAMMEDKHLLQGLNVYKGKVTNYNVAIDLGYDFLPPHRILALDGHPTFAKMQGEKSSAKK